MSVAVKLLLSTLAFAGGGQAQVTSAETELLRHVVLLKVGEGPGSERGGGVLVGADEQYVVALTAAHVVADERGGTSRRVLVRFQGMLDWVQAESVLAVDMDRDLAAIAIPRTHCPLDVPSLFQNLRVAIEPPAEGASGHAIGNDDDNRRRRPVAFQAGGASRFRGRGIQPGFSGGALTTDDWFLCGMIQSQGGAGQDHGATDLVGLRRFCEDRGIPWHVPEEPALAVLEKCREAGRHVYVRAVKTASPGQTSEILMDLELTDRTDRTLWGSIEAVIGNVGQGVVSLVPDGNHLTVKFPSIAHWGELGTLEFESIEVERMGDFAVFSHESPSLSVHLVAPRGAAELVFHQLHGDPLARQGLVRAVQKVNERTASQHRRSGNAPLVAPLFLFGHESPDFFIPHRVQDRFRETGVVLRGVVSFDDSATPDILARQSACHLVVLDQEGQPLSGGRIRVPAAIRPLEFEVSVPQGTKLVRIGAQMDSSWTNSLVVVRSFTITPR